MSKEQAINLALVASAMVSAESSRSGAESDACWNALYGIKDLAGVLAGP